MVLKTAQAIEADQPIADIVNHLHGWIKETRIFVGVRDLKYMLKGGRVSGNKGFIANLLGLTPIVSMDSDGKSMLFGKSFSQESSMKKIIRHIQKTGKGKSIWNFIVLHAHNPEGADNIAHQMTLVSGKEPVSVVDISPVIGMHAGIGTIAIALLFDN